jgi:hypothetical protein
MGRATLKCVRFHKQEHGVPHRSAQEARHSWIRYVSVRKRQAVSYGVQLGNLRLDNYRPFASRDCSKRWLDWNQGLQDLN